MWVPEISTLFPGDCVEDPIPLVDEDSTPDSQTVQELLDSLKRMAGLKPEWVLANHAAPQRGTARLRANLAYLQELRMRASSAATLDELGSELPPQADWSPFYREAHQAQIRMAWEQRSVAMSPDSQPKQS
jgi:hypothetical protein